MKVLIDLPDVIKDADGNEYEATGERRPPKRGEYLLWDRGVALAAMNDMQGDYIILRRKWTWPSWLGGWGFASESSGRVRWYQCRPDIQPGVCAYSGVAMSIADLQKISPTFTPPVITDWTKPILNPYYKGNA